MKRYMWNFLIGIDQLANTVFGGFPDETLSSRMGKRVRLGNCPFCTFMCNVLHLFDKDHCNKSIEEDEGIIIIILEKKEL